MNTGDSNRQRSAPALMPVSVEITAHGIHAVQSIDDLQPAARRCNAEISAFEQDSDGIIAARIGPATVTTNGDKATVSAPLQENSREQDAALAAAITVALMQQDDDYEPVVTVTILVKASCNKPPQHENRRFHHQKLGNEVSVTTFPDGRTLPVWHDWKPDGNGENITYQAATGTAVGASASNAAGIGEMALTLLREMRLRTVGASVSTPDPPNGENDDAAGLVAAAPAR